MIQYSSSESDVDKGKRLRGEHFADIIDERLRGTNPLMWKCAVQLYLHNAPMDEEIAI